MNDTPLRLLERWLGVVTVIAGAIVVASAASSPLVNREIAWTRGHAKGAAITGQRVRFADSTALFEAIDRHITAQMEDGRVPGRALAIVHEGAIVHARGFGVADRDDRPVTPDTPFILGSLTKTVTATVVLQLVDDGRVQIDTPVRRYLPWFAVRDPRASARITIRELLNHTSGIPKSAGLQLVRGEAAVTPAQQERLMDHVRLAHAPGTRFEYSNANYWLLGLVIEAVTDTSYADYVRSHIFTPLRMTRSFTDESNAERSGLADGHRVWFGYPRAEELPFYWRELAVGYLISSANDMAKYLLAQTDGGAANGVRLLSPQRLHEMQAPPPGSPYAMGWLAGVVDSVPVLWHTGAVANYHGDMLLVPSRGWGVVQLANTNNFVLEGQLSAGIQGIAALLLGFEPPAPARLGFRTAYVLIALTALAWLAWRIMQLVGMPRWQGTAIEDAAGSHRRRPSLRHPTSVLVDPGVSLGLVAGVPLLLGSPLTTLQWFAPDLTDWLIANAVVALVVMMARLAVMARQSRVQPVADSVTIPEARLLPDHVLAGTTSSPLCCAPAPSTANTRRESPPA